MLKFVIAICILITSCSSNNNQQEEININNLKQTNKQLKKIINIYSKDYYNIENYLGVDESYFQWKDELNVFVNQLSSEESFKGYDSLIETLKKWKLDERTMNIDEKLISTKVGKEILVNRILTANLEVLLDCLDAQKKSNFQVNSIKLSPVNYDVKYEKNLNLDVELVFRNWIPKEMIIYNTDTIQIDTTSRNKNIFRLKVLNPKKGLNKVIVPFYCSRWGKEFIDSMPVIFNVK